MLKFLRFGRQIDRHTDRSIDIQADRLTYIQLNRHTDRQIAIQTDQ